MSDELLYDYPRIRARRASGWTWADIAVADYPGRTGKQLRQAYWQWGQRQNPSLGTDGPARPDLLSGDIHREGPVALHDIRSLEDLVRAFSLDPEEWEVKEFRLKGGGSKWDQSVRDGLKATSERVQVSVHFVRRMEKRAEILQASITDALEDLRNHAPPYETPQRIFETRALLEPNPMLAVLALMDPHFGMLAYGKEVGADYDMNIATRDYMDIVYRALGAAAQYNLDRILFIVGNDLAHVDGMGTDSKGNRRGGATTKGTTQDVDTRLSKLFSAVRRAMVEATDAARTLAPVDLLVVPGNHDSETMYRLGEVLHAWYRNDDEVNVIYGANKRKYYGWENVALMFTHGEELKRHRDNLPMIMATECPAPIWTASEHGSREIITGHFHINMQGGYYPTAEANESRAIRTRSLPGLTPEDAWHHEEGYKHHRAGTLLMYRPSGFAGLHEFNVEETSK